MIQRIQTVYMLLVAVLMIVSMILPVGTLVGPDQSMCEFHNLYIAQAEVAKDYAPWSLFAVLLIVAVLSVVNIVLFKKRMLQIRLCIFGNILLFGYYLMLIAFVNMMPAADTAFSMSLSVCNPFIAIVLNWLAIRAIGKDEMLVRAYDRLR